LKTETQLILRAKEDMDDIVRREAVVDGVSLQDIEKYRVRSSVFDLSYRENNIFELPSKSTRAISDGYWVFSQAYIVSVLPAHVLLAKQKLISHGI
jgi:hypothetical protein